MDTPISQPPRLNIFKRLLDNPVIIKELKGRMRGRQGFVTLTIYLLLISFFVTMIYLFMYSEGSSIGTPGTCKPLARFCSAL